MMVMMVVVMIAGLLIVNQGAVHIIKHCLLSIARSASYNIDSFAAQFYYSALSDVPGNHNAYAHA